MSDAKHTRQLLIEFDSKFGPTYCNSCDHLDMRTLVNDAKCRLFNKILRPVINDKIIEHMREGIAYRCEQCIEGDKNYKNVKWDMAYAKAKMFRMEKQMEGMTKYIEDEQMKELRDQITKFENSHFDEEDQQALHEDAMSI